MLCHFFDFITKTTVPQRTRGPVVTVEALIQEKNKANYGKDKINFSSLAVTNKEILYIHTTSTTETHVHMHIEYEEKKGGGNKITLLSLHLVILQSLPVSKKEERWGGQKEGRIKH